MSDVRVRGALVCLFVTCAVALSAPGAAAAAEPTDDRVVILNAGAYWRSHATFRTAVVRTEKGLAPTDFACETPPPPDGWTAPDFDDHAWCRVQGTYFGGWGGARNGGGTSPLTSLLCLRGKFTVTDPAKAGDLTLDLAYRGGVVVYLNGTEVARGHLPADTIDAATLAEDYPKDAFVGPSGAPIRSAFGDPAKYGDRLALRVRHLAGVRVPARLLRKGVNVLAVRIHRAPYHAAIAKRDRNGVLRLEKNAWSTAALTDLRLTGPATDAVVPHVDRPPGVQAWVHPPTTWVHDMDYGDPNETGQVTRIVGARNGAFSGQVVIGRDQPLSGLAATATALEQVGGDGVIPADAVQVRYARPVSDRRGPALRFPGFRGIGRFDVLAEVAPKEAPVYRKGAPRGQPTPRFGAVLPIWVTVRVPKDAPPGAYRGRLAVAAAGIEPISVPIHVTVCGWTLPEPRDFVGHVGLIQSPETLAIKYGVPMWSDAHFRLIERSLRLMGQVGNKVVHIHAIGKSNFGNEQTIIRWTKPAGEGVGTPGKTAGPDTWKPDYAILNRYLDLYEKHCGLPRVACLYVWDPFTGGHPRWSKKVIEGVGAPITVVAPTTGAASEGTAPVYGTPEAEAFWRPVIDDLRALLKKRGIADDRVMIGISSDKLPTKEVVAFLGKVAPGLKWVHQGHSMWTHLYKTAPIGYVSHCWNTAFPPDPAVKRYEGWRRPFLTTLFPRYGMGTMNPAFYPHSPLGVHRNIIEGAFTGNLHGFGRVGADLWPVIADRRGRMKSIAARFLQSDLGHANVSLATLALLAPGPDGALATARFENVREGQQEAEARAFIERALATPALRAKLGDDLAARCRAVLDERTRRYRIACRSDWLWFSAGVEQQAEKLFAVAGDVAAAANGVGRDPAAP